MQLVVAKCNNCGAAVRLDPSSPQVVCDYCHETLLVQGTGTAEVPRVTIAPPPEPLDEVRQTIGIAIGAAVLAVVGLVLAITTQVWVLLVLTVIGSTFAVLGGLGAPRKKAYLADIRLLREQGIPARATVRSLSAEEGLAATLALDLDVKGEHRSLTHRASIPMLLVPRVTAGCALPVLVHPHDPERIEIQWHLV